MTTQMPESFLSINGRIRRKTYLIRGTLLAIPIVILNYIYSFNNNFGLPLIIIIIVLTVLQIIQFIKRLHDIDMSGWYWLICLIPLVNLIFGLYVIFKEGTLGSNEYWESPKQMNIPQENKPNLKDTNPNITEKKNDEEVDNLIDFEPETKLHDGLKNIIAEPKGIPTKASIISDELEINQIKEDINSYQNNLKEISNKTSLLSQSLRSDLLTELEFKDKKHKLEKQKQKIENKIIELEKAILIKIKENNLIEKVNLNVKPKIDKLTELLKNELISEEEYEIKKNSLIHKEKIKLCISEKVFEYFDILKIVEEKKKKDIDFAKEREVDLIIELQEKREELIDNIELCPKCNAMYSIIGDYCQACGQVIK